MKQQERIDWADNIPFWGVHLAAIVGVVLLGFSWTGVALAAALYVVRMFGLTAGYHRYLSHRSYKTGRVFQFVLAFLGAMCAQRGPLWWAAHHRRHHKHSDDPGDVHSPRQRGFWWAHMNWFLVVKPDEEPRGVADLMRYPELRWLDRHWYVSTIGLAAALLAIAGPWGLVWGFFVSTTVLWHGTFLVNSLAHIVGRRRYETEDDSRNSLVIALLTLGEGWHNNHHHYQRSERQGFFWWEIDLTHYVLKALSAVGVVWDLHEPPAHVRDEGRGRALSAERRAA